MCTILLLLSLLLNGFVRSDALSVPAPASRGKFSEAETVSIAPRSIDDNRAPQVANEKSDNDEERGLLTDFEEATEPLLGLYRGALKEEHVPTNTQTTLIAKDLYVKGSYLTRPEGWTPTRKQMKMYEELRRPHAKSPQEENFDKLIAYGRTPFFWKGMIDARSTNGLSGLPPYKPAEKSAELNRLRWFTAALFNLIGSELKRPQALVTMFRETMKDNIRSRLRIAVTSVRNTKKIIKGSHSVNDLLLMDISPVIYAKALANSNASKKEDTRFKNYLLAYQKMLDALRREIREELGLP